MSAALESLRAMADKIVAGYVGERRPSWGPALVLEDELLAVLLELGLLTSEDKPVARLWSRFTNPSNGYERNPKWAGTAGSICVGFELHAGQKKNGRRSCIFETWKNGDGDWRSGPMWGKPSDPNSDWAARYPLRIRSVELGAHRVAEFAKRPEEQMRIGGIFTSSCGICGRTIYDPPSLERGIGPECFGRIEEARRVAQIVADVVAADPDFAEVAT